MLPDMLQFIVDTQLPPALALFFRQKGFDATHVFDYPSGALTSDSEKVLLLRKILKKYVEQ
jgi:predicted nuclease of predicted toxin-antitoxin system